MRRPLVPSALAASTLAVLVLTTAASSAPKPRRAACEAALAGGATLVGATPQPLSRTVGLPTRIDLRAVPRIPDAVPSTEPAAEMPSPSIARAKKLKAGAAGCIPQSAPTVSGAPAQR
ncbi:MAG TPA: hypothetical protein VGJ25_12115 [Gaiellaceae bacterium]